jgi:hypothetical protein
LNDGTREIAFVVRNVRCDASLPWADKIYLKFRVPKDILHETVIYNF